MGRSKNHEKNVIFSRMKKFVIKYVLFLICVIHLTDIRAQYTPKNSKKDFYGNKRISKPLFRWVTGDHSRHGIQLTFGPTYTFTKSGADEEVFQQNDTLMRYSKEAKGKIGAFAEIGMVHITKRPRKFIQYYDWGIGYKHFAGKEYSNASLHRNDSIIANLSGEGDFYTGHLFGRFSVHSVFQINPTLFLDNALGANVDYILMGKNKSYDGFHLPETQRFQSDIIGQLHYSFGFGFKPREGLFLIPGVRLPILGAYEWDGGNPRISWFSSQYYPAMFNLKIVLLFSRDPNRCPPVETNEEDKKRAKEYMNR